jgi:hypothetical protein
VDPDPDADQGSATLKKSIQIEIYNFPNLQNCIKNTFVKTLNCGNAISHCRD